MPKVLISDKLSPAAVEIFRRRGVDVDLKPGLSPAELRAIIPAYDGLAIRSATKVTKELLDVATNLTVSAAPASASIMSTFGPPPLAASW